MIVRGLSAVPGVTEEKVEALTRLPAREEDIFIASYPRSGSKTLNSYPNRYFFEANVDSSIL